ncbi:L-threonylcarbamoyladenylate synthase [Desulforhopalus sp. 52FAK]
MKKKPKKSRCNNLVEKRIGSSIDLAVNFLQQGRIVAFPTETYYGLAVDPENPLAVDRLYQLKKRPVHKPLLLLVDHVSWLGKLTTGIPDEFIPLMGKYWPGPLTLIFPAADTVDPKVSAGTGTVGIRISPNPIASQLVKRFNRAITATSANTSGMDPAKSAKDVLDIFGDSVDYILDGGFTNAGLCSTIVGIEKSTLTVIRQGAININCA